MLRRRSVFRPFAARGRHTIAAIILTFALISAVSITLSIWATGRSKHRATLVEVAARQRTLAERYVKDVLLARNGARSDPAYTGAVLAQSARALLDGGTAPAVYGDDDETELSPAKDPTVRGELEQERRLVADLTATGSTLLAGRPVTGVRLRAHEHLAVTEPVQRLRVLAALTSNVSLNAARTIATQADHNVNSLIYIQVGVGAVGFLTSLLLAWALIGATRRQTAHFRSLVTSSTDLVAVLGGSECRYVSQSLVAMIGRPEGELLGHGFERFVHEEDRASVEAARRRGEPREIVIRVRNRFGEWRHLEAHVTDLRRDRHVHGVVLNARDITERVLLEQELTRQAERDSFGNQLIEALEMADEEEAAYHVVERAMATVAPDSPMELLLSDSSRAHLERAASSPAGAPGCPVESPFSCVAVRRGNPVVFESSEALNACPKLRDRPDGECSAVCVPVSFMGRALGVLHTTGEVGKPLAPEQVAQLTTLATQAGARIGTVRAFARTQLQASTDGLTGLVNRRTLETQLRGWLNRGGRFAVALVDLDRFKKLNDTHGHEAGDRALRLFAQVAKAELRDGDAVARWGGEEFMIAFDDLDQHQAVTVLERIRARLAEAHVGDHPRFTASFGVTDSTAAQSLEQIVHIADCGLYAAKARGRDQIALGEAVADDPGRLTVVDQPKSSSHRPQAARPAFHEAADEEEPHPSGLEIR